MEEESFSYFNLEDNLRHIREEIYKLPDSRSKSLATTKLDECEMWLEKAVNNR